MPHKGGFFLPTAGIEDKNCVVWLGNQTCNLGIDHPRQTSPGLSMTVWQRCQGGGLRTSMPCGCRRALHPLCLEVLQERGAHFKSGHGQAFGVSMTTDGRYRDHPGHTLFKHEVIYRLGALRQVSPQCVVCHGKLLQQWCRCQLQWLDPSHWVSGGSSS